MTHKTIVDLIRHGEPLGGRAIRGNSVDDPLSELGWLQMRTAVSDYEQWDVIISSPMIRCSEFSTELSLKLDIPLIIEDDFKEVGFGSWEGRTQTEIELSNPDEFANFYRDPVNARPVGAESLSLFHSRVIESYNKFIELYAGQHILVVSHAGVIRAMMTNALQTELSSMYRIKILNAGITRLFHDGESSILERHSFNLNDLKS